MIKRFFLIFASLVFAVGILGISVVRTTAQTSSKIKVSPINAIPSLVATPTPTPVDYYLPYPGILPDHFLYSLKMVRDKILLLFTRDPIKKSQLMLLFADKRLGAGKALVEGGKADLGISTLIKGEKYLEQATTQAKIAKDANKDVSLLYEKLGRASLKHLEVLEIIKTKVSEQTKPIVDEIGKYPRAGYQAVTK